MERFGFFNLPASSGLSPDRISWDEYNIFEVVRKYNLN
jgi:hypothetical protein